MSAGATSGRSGINAGSDREKHGQRWLPTASHELLDGNNATGAVGGPRLPGKFVPIETSVTNGKSVHPRALLLRNVTKRIWKIGDIVDVPGKHHWPPKCY
jgi:hypothetical protein